MRGISMFALAVLFSATTLLFAVRAATNESVMEEFSVKEYEDFHDVLHPLQHEALPKKDFRRIRAQSSLLVNRGKAIVKLGVPQGTSDEHKEDFAKGLTDFSKVLAKFKADAGKGNNAKLKVSY